jgi:hypothetical protein
LGSFFFFSFFSFAGLAAGAAMAPLSATARASISAAGAAISVCGGDRAALKSRATPIGGGNAHAPSRSKLETGAKGGGHALVLPPRQQPAYLYIRPYLGVTWAWAGGGTATRCVGFGVHHPGDEEKTWLPLLIYQ